MAYLTNGLYLMKQPSTSKGFDHYGILDVGNRMSLPGASYWRSVVIHQTPPHIRVDRPENTGNWEIIGWVRDEQDAITRIKHALRNPSYELFGNNCEHFARFVATGRRESTQLQSMAALVALGFLGVTMIRASR